MLSNTSLSILRHKCLKAATPTWQQGVPHFTLMNENESAARGGGGSREAKGELDGSLKGFVSFFQLSPSPTSLEETNSLP